MYKEDTIAAIATPVGEGGVGIVRVSGPDAERIASEIFSCAKDVRKPRSHVLYHGTIRDPDQNCVVDEVLLTIMRKPHSYTGEDIVEVNCHGGPLLVRRVLGLVLSRGARHAEPGEFTKRAFLNGRMDLVQSEAVLDLIRARTEKALSLAADQIKGELSKWVGELREDLLDILVQVEAAIDFPEEEIELMQRRELIAKVEALRGKIHLLIQSYEWGRLFREGAKVCICGRPNVGKSSLLNALLGEQRVIVTPIPGTTRDVVEESINLGGLPVVLWDTAGIRETDDHVERMGVDLSKQYLASADVALLVLDGSEPLTTEDRALLGVIKTKKTLVIINKEDLPRRLEAGCLRQLVGDAEVISVSTTERTGMERLKTLMRNIVLSADPEPPVVITNERHKAALVSSERSLKDAVASLTAEEPAEIVAVCLQEACEGLGEIIGVVVAEDVLERIFTSFCIGK
jgi:tRNA modification GTPase